MAKFIPSVDDDLRGLERYELSSGRMILLSKQSIKFHGLKKLLEAAGERSTGSMLPVYYCGSSLVARGELVGYLPDDFDERHITSTSLLYDPRPRDITRDGDDAWAADKSLGPGDLLAIVGFVPSEPPEDK